MREPGLAFGRGPGRSAGTAGRSERRQRVLAAGADALDGSPLRPGSLSLLLPHCGVLGRLEVLHFLGDRSAEGLAFLSALDHGSGSGCRCDRARTGGEARAVELAPVEPGVEPPQRAGVGAAGVRADGGLDQAAPGLRRAADRGLFGVGPGG